MALESAVECLQQAKLEEGKKKKFLKDVQETILKVNNQKESRDRSLEEKSSVNSLVELTVVK